METCFCSFFDMHYKLLVPPTHLVVIAWAAAYSTKIASIKVASTLLSDRVDAQRKLQFRFKLSTNEPFLGNFLMNG